MYLIIIILWLVYFDALGQKGEEIEIKKNHSKLLLLCHRKNHEFNFDILNYLQLIHKFLIKKNRKTLESKSDENSQLKKQKIFE